MGRSGDRPGLESVGKAPPRNRLRSPRLGMERRQRMRLRPNKRLLLTPIEGIGTRSALAVVRAAQQNR